MREEVKDWLGGNICRCTGYKSIVEAVIAVANESSAGRGLGAQPDTAGV